MSIDIVESELASVLFGGNIPTVILLDYEAYSNGRSKPIKPILLINEKAIDVYSDNELLAIAWHCTFYYIQNIVLNVFHHIHHINRLLNHSILLFLYYSFQL